MANKILLAIIAAGLWANVLTNMTRPAHADAESSLSSMETSLSDIEHDIHGLYGGICLNSMIS
jgi:hypothetical protein